MPLALAVGCAIQPEREVIYSPTEPGLTLVFENPSIESQNRTQLRVANANKTDEGLEVDISVDTLQGSGAMKLQCMQDGGVFIVGSDDKRATVLPPGFPDKTQAWQSDGISYSVIGRARADLEEVKLQDPVGIWVEAAPVSAQSLNSGVSRARIFFLPGVGEAETKELREGKWITVNRLIGRGFSDLP
jgi:hypothetical protein